jgi:hypothetical protein
LTWKNLGLPRIAKFKLKRKPHRAVRFASSSGPCADEFEKPIGPNASNPTAARRLFSTDSPWERGMAAWRLPFLLSNVVKNQARLTPRNLASGRRTLRGSALPLGGRSLRA